MWINKKNFMPLADEKVLWGRLSKYGIKDIWVVKVAANNIYCKTTTEKFTHWCYILPPPLAEIKEQLCEWTVGTYDWGEGFKTGCGQLVQAIIAIETMSYCPYCGRKRATVR
jgi:hypothetical protein